MSITIEEKQLLVGCSHYKEFVEKYTVAFGKNIQSYKLYNRTRNMWTHRDRFIKDVESFKVAQRTVMIPATIKNKALGNSLKCDDDIQIKSYNQLLYIGELLKEQNALFTKLATHPAPTPQSERP